MAVTRKEALVNTGLVLLLLSAAFLVLNGYTNGSYTIIFSFRNDLSAFFLLLAIPSGILGIYCWVKAGITKDD